MFSAPERPVLLSGVVRPQRALDVAVPRTTAEWEAETDVIRLAKCYRGRRWFPRLRLFAIACCRRIWDDITWEASRQAVEVAEQFAHGQVGKRELWAASQAAGLVVQSITRVSETRSVYGTLAEALASTAWACTLPAEHPAQHAPKHLLRAVYVRGYEEVTRGGGFHRQAGEHTRGLLLVEEAELVALLRELVGCPFK